MAEGQGAGRRLRDEGLTARLFAAAALAIVALASPAGSSAPSARLVAIPRPDHTLVVVMENHGYPQILGGGSTAPYIHKLAKQGASFTKSFALTHPSQPNYLALFSGSTQGVHGDSCPHAFSKPNLGEELSASGLGFAGYSEGLPKQGSMVCDRGGYARKHVPWTNFTNVPASASKTYAQFPNDYTRLPEVSFVIPNLCHDMHDCSVKTGDRWLKKHIRPYVIWAKAHDSVLILTWDEDDYGGDNRIATIIAGAGVTAGKYGERIDHYSVLRTIEDMYGLGHAGHSASASPIVDIWEP